MTKISGCLALLLGTTCLAPSVAWAADADTARPVATLQEVVVTASKAGETNLQQTAIAVSAFNANDLQKAQISNVSDLMGSVPSLTMSTSITYAEIYIRGIGSNNITGGGDASSTVQVDGVYLGRPYSQFADFMDVARVEVLRGPQGTLYGRNSVGGTINVVSRAPTDEFMAVGSLTGGNYGLFQTQDYASGPLIAGVLDASIAVNYTRHDGYLKNIIPSGNDVWSANNGGGRIQLRYRPTDKIDATTRLDYTMSNEVPESYSKITAPFDPATNSILGDFHKVALGLPQKAITRNGGVAEDVSMTINDNLKLRSLTSYRTASTASNVDADSTDLNITNYRVEEHQKQYSQEFNLIGNYTSFNYVAGLFYYHEDDHSKAEPNIVPNHITVDFRPQTHTDAYAVFGQGNYHLTPELDLTAGMRWNWEHKSLDQNGRILLNPTGVFLTDTPPNFIAVSGPFIFTTSKDFFATTPKLGIEYRPVSDVMLYASATRGYKSGGFLFSASSPVNAAYAPEKLWSYEAGAKTEWFDHRLRANLTAFYYDYTNLQVSILFAPGVLVIKNAATATTKGAELELAATPVSGLNLTANIGYLDAQYNSFPAAPTVPGGLGTVNAKGNYLTQAPKWTANIVAEYTKPLEDGNSVFVRASYKYIGKQFFEPTNNPHQTEPGYNLVDLSAGYNFDHDKWQIVAWGRNLGDTGYITGYYSAAATWSGTVGAPRTFGMTVRRTW